MTAQKYNSLLQSTKQLLLSLANQSTKKYSISMGHLQSSDYLRMELAIHDMPESLLRISGKLCKLAMPIFHSRLSQSTGKKLLYYCDQKV
jgi:hypothetical protein